MELEESISDPNDDLVGLGTDIPRSLRKKFKSEANNRDIPMSKATAQALELWLATPQQGSGDLPSNPMPTTAVGSTTLSSPPAESYGAIVKEALQSSFAEFGKAHGEKLDKVLKAVEQLRGSIHGRLDSDGDRKEQGAEGRIARTDSVAKQAKRRPPRP